MVFSTIRILPWPKQRSQVIEILRSVQDLTRPLLGCAGCWLSEEDSLDNHVRYTEQWESKEALEEHVRSELYRRVLAAIELSRQNPEVKFYFTTETRGFDLIESLRTPANAPRSANSRS